MENQRNCFYRKILAFTILDKCELFFSFPFPPFPKKEIIPCILEHILLLSILQKAFDNLVVTLDSSMKISLHCYTI